MDFDCSYEFIPHAWGFLKSWTCFRWDKELGKVQDQMVKISTAIAALSQLRLTVLIPIPRP